MVDFDTEFRSAPAEALARPLYRADLPYHNFGHALEAIAAGHEIVKNCRTEGIRVEAEVVYYALLFHDAGYHEEPGRIGFDTKEAYSAHLAAVALTGLGVSTRTIEKVERAILSTHRLARFVTVEEKAVRAADLAGLAADYPVFRANAEKLRAEHELLTGERIAWRDWILGVSEVLRFYLKQEIRLTSKFVNADGESRFHERAGANLARLSAELAEAISPPRNS